MAATEQEALEVIPAQTVELKRSFPTIGQSIVILVSFWLLVFTSMLVRIAMKIIAPSGLQFAILYFIPIGLLLAIVLTIAALRGRFHEPGFSWAWPRRSVFVQVIAIAILVFVASSGFNAFLSRFLGKVPAVIPPPDWGVAITWIIIAPIMEEILFRGIILHSFLKSMTPPKAILISSILFALAHASAYQLFVVFLLGVLQGWLYWRSHSIAPAIAIHMLANSLGIGLYSFRMAASTASHAPLSSLELIVALTVSTCLLISLVFWLRRLDRIYSSVPIAQA